VFSIKKNELPVNEEIKDKEVRLIDENGKMIGIVETSEALKISMERNLDLVKIVPNANPPVCKIMDYGKHMFELAKREKEARKKQKIVTIKEVRLSSKINFHDLEVKMKNAAKFLQDGDKVKVSVRFRGREMKYTVAGKELLEKFAAGVSEFGSVEKEPKLEGRNMILILNPRKPTQTKT